MTIDPKTAADILAGIVRLQQAANDLFTKTLPVLENGSDVIAAMKADGHEIPTEMERAILKQDADRADAVAQTAIDKSAAGGN